MKRRHLVAMMIGAPVAARPMAVSAQGTPSALVGLLSDGTPEGFAPRVAGVRKGLAEAGFVEGRNLTIEARWAASNYDALPKLAAELVAAKVSVVVALGTEKVVRAAMAASSTMPIIATLAGDPVKRGIVSSISRPGGNVTVVSLFTSSTNALVAKRVELLHEVAPAAKKFGWLVDTNILDYDEQAADVQDAAKSLGIEVQVAEVARLDGVEAAFRSIVQAGARALLEAGPIFYGKRALLASLALQASMPTLFEWRDMVEAGGLLSYGPDLASVHRQVGLYAARILRGEKAGDLPVVQEPRIELVLNLRTAAALGLTVPPALMARADSVIE